MSPSSPIRQAFVRPAAALFAFALGACCLFPVTTLAANSGGTVVRDVPARGFISYIGTYEPGAGEAGGGQVHIDSDFAGHVYGGYSKSGHAVGNSVTVSGGEMGSDVYGGFSDSGNAVGNSVTLNGGTLTGTVYGGRSESGTVQGNRVTVSGGTVDGGIFGGGSLSATAEGNSVTVSGGTVNNDIYGGNSTDGNAQGNSVTVSGGTVDGGIYGGVSSSGNAEGNSVTVSGGTVDNEVTGGYSVSGHVTGNSVSVSGGTMDKEVTGGYSVSGNVQGNSVTVSGGTVKGAVYGGRSSSGNVTGNSATVSGGTVGGDTFGGYSVNGNAEGNSVTVSGGTVAGVVGGYSVNGTAEGNSATVIGGEIMGYVYGGMSTSGTAVGNSVTVSGGTVGNAVIGGRSDSGHVTGNSVTVSGGTVGNAVIGGMSESGTVEGNSVTVTGGTVNNDIYGGGSSVNGNVVGNSVTVTGGTVRGAVYGGSSLSGNAVGNSVTLQGRPEFGANSLISGGLNAAGGSTVSSGNTLNVFTSGLSAANINWNPYANGGAGAAQSTFQHYVFAVPGAGQTALTLTGDHDGGSKPTTFAATDTFTLVPSVQPGAVRQSGVGTLITNPNGLAGVPAAWNGQRVQAQQGLALVYDVTLRTTATSLETVTDVSLHPRSSAVTNGRAASMGLMTMGADLAAGKGLESAKSAASGAQGLAGGSSSWGLVPFVAMQGGAWNGSGSGDDANGIGLMAGLVKRWSLSNADLFVGAFFETGTGHTSGSASGLSYDSDATTTGGGLLARVDLTQTWLKGLYGEVSFRAGGLRQQWDSDFRDLGGAMAGYDNTSTYTGLHAGLGYLWQVNEAASLDVYGKYFWNRLDGFDATLAGDSYRFDAMNSHRLRTGARFNYAVSDKVTPYVGAAYEHEFGGKARASLYGYGLPSESLSGSTAIAEVGLRVTPDKGQGVFVDFNVQGLFGNRQGAMGSLMLGYEF